MSGEAEPHLPGLPTLEECGRVSEEMRGSAHPGASVRGSAGALPPPAGCAVQGPVGAPIHRPRGGNSRAKVTVTLQSP